MTHALSLDCRDAEGLLVRVLGLAERRGYRPVAVSARAHGERLRLDLTVESQRPAAQLVRHLEKLLDVRHIELYAQPALALGAAR